MILFNIKIQQEVNLKKKKIISLLDEISSDLSSIFTREELDIINTPNKDLDKKQKKVRNKILKDDHNLNKKKQNNKNK